jgi:hypothetical protein
MERSGSLRVSHSLMSKEGALRKLEGKSRSLLSGFQLETPSPNTTTLGLRKRVWEFLRLE